MVPPALMLAIKKRRTGCLRATFLALALVFCICGCRPPGPRALLKGERLIREGKYAEAVESLQTATRLLPKNAQAYNHLGLALHGNRQFAPALAAYQKALALDHKLAAAHYNLGCLYLEQNVPSLAVEQLTSYSLLQPNSLDGWLKLGEAQLRDHKFDAAEKSFKAALTLQPHHPEAFNGLGIVQIQRRRPQESLAYFNQAIVQNTNYSPALLNAAIVIQQYSNNRQLALDKYRRYLALQPQGAHSEAVSALASRIDAELNPPPPPAPARIAQVNTPPPPAPVIKTNLPPAQTNPPTRLASNHPATAVAATPARSNPPPLAVNPPRAAVQTNQAATNPFVISNLKPAPTPEPPKVP